jgi:uncharacterized protein involved in type VI secretion and phage assembly
MAFQDSLLHLADSDREQLRRTAGVTTAVVTDNNDPQGLARVKVRFPWSSDASAWAPVMSPMAGDQRGLYCLPEVDDVVLVMFDGCRIDSPYVIGAVWNGKHKPPLPGGKKKNDLRLFKSRSGHTITLDDSSGKEQVTIVDKSGKNTIVIDSNANKITIHAGQDLNIESDGAIAITAATTLKLKGTTVKINDDALEVT